MALSQRPASRFFAAFYRWNLHTQRSRPCAIASQCGRRGIQYPISSRNPRNYHATRLLRQHGQPEPQLQDEEADSITEDTQDGLSRSAERIEGSQQANSVQEEAAIEQPGTEKQEPLPELSESDLETQELKNAVRTLMRNVPSSVAVITVASVDPETKKPVPMGVAVSSLSTVTLDPPTVSFNIKEPSKTLDAIRAANGLFRVHFPKADRLGADVVEVFCRGNHPDAYSVRHKNLRFYMPTPTKTAKASSSLAPQILNDSIRAAMECTVTHELPVADHVILVARVDSMEHKTSKEPTVMYVNGRYMRSNGSVISNHGNPHVSAASDDTWSVWNYPLFSGEQERRDYVEHIKSVVKGDPAYLDKDSKKSYRDLELSLPYAPQAFGINTELLIAQSRHEAGRKNGLEPRLRSMDVLYDFYGRLSPSSRTKIADRAKALVIEDPQFLSLGYKALLSYLNISPGTRDLLPSDLLKPLRAEGLVDEFESRGASKPSNLTYYDITQFEQIEHRLRKHLSTLTYKTALETRVDSLMEYIGEPKTLSNYFIRCRFRLLAEAHPQQFNASLVDIMGEVTQEEAHVVLSRIIDFLQIRNLTVLRKRIITDWNEILRLVGVHPTITGMDIEYLFGKIKHLYYSTPQFRSFGDAIDKMLEPWFSDKLNWNDLEERVKQFVQKLPLRATTWSSKDVLAAMGLRGEVKVFIPEQNVHQPLTKGHILDTLVAKELKTHYGNGTEEENQAIAKYLKETYNFDVHDKPKQYPPYMSASGSSSDDMQEAMMASLGADRLEDKEHQVAFRKQGIAAPRIRYRNNQNSNGRRQPAERSSQEKQNTKTGWTSYSIGGGRK